LGIAVPVAATVLGACIIEKHLTTSRTQGGPDAAFSLEPDEFKSMVNAVRVAEQAIGDVCYDLTSKEEASRELRRSLFAVRDIRVGEIFTSENVRSIRPGHGLPVSELSLVLGRCAKRAIERGTPLSREDY
jgi:sialic acid synthase SpsE